MRTVPRPTYLDGGSRRQVGILDNLSEHSNDTNREIIRGDNGTEGATNRHRQPRSTISVLVIDTGEGITREDQRMIFIPFAMNREQQTQVIYPLQSMYYNIGISLDLLYGNASY